MRTFQLFILGLLSLMTVGLNAQTVINETFDSGIPADWTVIDNNSDAKTWEGISSAGFTDSYCASIQSYAYPHDDYLITSQVTVEAGMKVTFAVKSSSSSWLESMEVLASTTGAAATDFTVQLGDYVDIPNTWTEHEIVITDNAGISAGDNIFLAFRCYSSGADKILMDDVSVIVPANNDLAVNSITTSPTTIFDGDNTTINANIKNVGILDQTSITVDFSVDGSSIGTQTIDLTAGSNIDVQQTWTATQSSHNITVSVPSDDNNANNSLTETIPVYGADALVQDFEGTWPPANWGGNIGTSYWHQVSFGMYEGSYCAYISAMATGDFYLATPKLSIGSGSAISFYASGSSGSIDVVYSTDNANWTLVETVSIASSYAQFNVDLSAIGTGNYYIAFVHNGQYQSTYIDNVIGPDLASEAPVAAINPQPANAATDISIATDLTWEAGATGGVPDNYKVYFGTDGDGSTTPTNMVNGTEQSETIYTPGSILDYETTYYWQIVPTNSEGDATSCPIWSFTTEADPTQPIPYSENFDGIANMELPTGWSATGYWVYDSQGVDNSHSMSINMHSGNPNAEVTSVSVGQLAATANQILFDYRICDFVYSNYPQTPASLSASDKIEVQVSNDGGSSFTTVYTIDQSTHVESIDYATITIDLDASYNSSSIIVKFKNTYASGDYIVNIDNFIVREMPNDPDLWTETSEMAFTNIPVSVVKTTPLNIRNDGTGTLEITDGDITFTDTDAADFSLGTVSYPIQLGAGESIDLDVIYTANSAGSKSATMEIVNNGVSETASIALTASSYELFSSYFEDFETTAADAMPEKWAEISTDLNWTGVLDNESEAYSPTKYLLLTNGTETTGDLFAVTPGFDISNSRLVFMAKRNNYVSTLSIGTMTDPEDATTFNEIHSVDLNENYTEYEVDFSSYSGTDVYIAFKHNLENTYAEIYLDNVTWEDVPTTPICEVSTTSINMGDATLNDADTDSFTITNTGVGTLTINDGDFTFTGTNSSEFSVIGVTYPIELAAEESADVTVNFIPQAEGSRTATLNIAHNGNNNPTSIALEGNGFDGIVEDFNGAFPPNGWTANDAWKALTFSTYEGDGGAWFNPGSEVTQAKLISPKLTIEDGDVFSFFAKKYNNDSELKVMYTEDTASKGWTELNSFTITNTEYEEKTTTLSLNGDYFIAIAGSGVAFTSTYVDFIKGPGLSETYSTTFTVTNNETGNPVSGAEINIDGNILNTDASGLAAVNLANGTYTYTITATGYFEQSSSITVDNAPAEVSISLVPVSGYTVTFTITDDVTTDPIEGATIDIEGTTITTDQDGLAALELENGTYNYSVSATGYVEETGSVTVNNASESISVSLTPIEETTATFTITDEAGTAIVGAEIAINSETVTTNASGMASITLEDGTYEYTITASGYAPVSGSLTMSSEDVEVPVEMQSVYELTFIVNNEAGDPIDGAFVVIGENFFTTDANGQITVDAVNGTYYYTVTKADFEMVSGEVTVNGADVTENVTLRLVYFVYFTVKDESNNLIEGATVTVEDSILTTNASGETQIELPNGTYAISISKDGYETVADEFTVQNSGLDISVMLPMVQNDYTVTFNVTDDEANVLEGAEVSFTDGTDTWTAVTDASGVATFNNIVNGDYDYTITKTDYETATGSLTVADNDVTTDVEMAPVGIANTTPANFNMYPNPTKGIINIQFEGTYNVVVLNSVGQVVLTNEKHNNASIDLTNQADGIYFIRIQNATNLFSKQVIVE